jgi:copper chaperone NosL
MKNNKLTLVLLSAFLLLSCAPKQITPVELFPEDECSACRMTVSNAQFASEIINKDGSAVKFDDLQCFENYRKTHSVDEFAAIFVKNYDTKEWIPFGKSIIVQTGIETPMGSGQIAVADQQRAKELHEQFPPNLAEMNGAACCATDKK